MRDICSSVIDICSSVLDICSFTLSFSCFLRLILLSFVNIIFVGKSEPAAEVQMCRNGIGPKCFLVLLRYVSQVEGFSLVCHAGLKWLELFIISSKFHSYIVFLCDLTAFGIVIK
jgi:hypothetical protein